MRRSLLYQIFPVYIVAILCAVGSLIFAATRVLDFPVVLTAIVVAALLIVAATILMSLIVVKRIHRPLQTIEQAARRFADGDLHHRVKVRAPQEITAIANTLNGMANQLSQTITRISGQRNELEAILSGMVEGVVVVDESLRIRSMNDAAARLFHRSATEHRGRSLIEYLRNSELDEFAAEVLTHSSASERTILLYDRETKNLQVHGTVLRGDDGRTAGVLLVLNDITRLKRLEDMRRDFVANVSHELRTPITSILGFVETLRDGAMDDPEQAIRFLEIVSTQANRLNLIVEDLLSLSRLESHEGAIPVSTHHLSDVLDRVREACARQAELAQVTIRRTVSGGSIVHVNSNLIEQALINLVNNAIKYSPNGSSVEVHATHQEGRLQILVEDHGQGIPFSDLSRVFERFYRVDRARSRDRGGTGLGLAIVKHIAIAHGGEVRVDSVEGKGSTFCLTIPQPPITVPE